MASPVAQQEDHRVQPRLDAPAQLDPILPVPEQHVGKTCVAARGVSAQEHLPILAAAGAQLKDVVEVSTFLRDMADFAAFNAIWETWIDRDNPPARSTGQVPMVSPGYKVEITVVAAVR